MRPMTRNSAATVGVVFALMVLISHGATPIPVMILDGESAGTYHDWQRVTPVLKKMIDETGLFSTTVVTAPAAGGDFTAFAPAFGKFQAVVSN